MIDDCSTVELAIREMLLGTDWPHLKQQGQRAHDDQFGHFSEAAETVRYKSKTNIHGTLPCFATQRAA